MIDRHRTILEYGLTNGEKQTGTSMCGVIGVNDCVLGIEFIAANNIRARYVPTHLADEAGDTIRSSQGNKLTTSEGPLQVKGHK